MDICGTTHKTVKRVIEREAARKAAMVQRAERPRNYDPVAEMVSTRVKSSERRISAKRLLPTATTSQPRTGCCPFPAGELADAGCILRPRNQVRRGGEPAFMTSERTVKYLSGRSGMGHELRWGTQWPFTKAYRAGSRPAPAMITPSVDRRWHGCSCWNEAFARDDLLGNRRAGPQQLDDGAAAVFVIFDSDVLVDTRREGDGAAAFDGPGVGPPPLHGRRFVDRIPAGG